MYATSMRTASQGLVVSPYLQRNYTSVRTDFTNVDAPLALKATTRAPKGLAAPASNRLTSTTGLWPQINYRVAPVLISTGGAVAVR